MIYQNHPHNPLGYGRRANPDTRVVTARGHHFDRFAANIDGAAWQRGAGSGFERQTHDHILARGDSAQYASRMIAFEARGRHFVAMLGAALLDRLETRTDLDAFHGIDAHHRACKIRIEPLEHRFPPARRHALGYHGDPGADGIAPLASPPDEIFELRHARRIRAEKWILVGRFWIHRLEHNGPHLRQVAVDFQVLAVF